MGGVDEKVGIVKIKINKSVRGVQEIIKSLYY